MTSAEYRRQRQAMERRKALNAQLVASKRKREEAARRERAARESARFAVQHRLDPGRVFEQQPTLTLSPGFSLRPSPSPEDRARRADQILHDLGIRRSKTPSTPERIIRRTGEVLNVR